MEKDLHSLLTYSIIYTERNKGKQKEYPMSDLSNMIVVAEMLETVLIEEVPTPEDTQAAVEDYVFWREATEGVK